MTLRLKITEALPTQGWSTVAALCGLTGLHSSVVRRELELMECDGFAQRKARESGQGYVWRASSPAKATQGHVYLHDGRKVLALESGINVTVAEVVDDEHWTLRSHYVCNANALRPLPMRYFHVETPR